MKGVQLLMPLRDYDLSLEQELPPCGKRLGISYVRASGDSVIINVDDSTIEIAQGEKYVHYASVLFAYCYSE